MKKTVKILSLILALAMMFSLAACGSKAEETPAEAPAEDAPAAENAEDPAAVDYSTASLDEIKAALTTVVDGKLTMATSPDFAPYEFYAIDEKGNPTLAGFDVALAGYIAEYLGLELEVIPMDFDGIVNELMAGNVDIGMAGISPKPERATAMDFSDVYYEGGQCFVTVKDKADSFKTMEDLNQAGLSIAAQNGSIQMDLANQFSADADVVPLVKVTDIIAELVSGKLDGAYVETLVAESYAKNYPELQVAMEVPYEAEGNVVGVQKGNAALLAGVNMALKAAIDDGSFAQFVADANELAQGETFEGLLENAD